jgi:DNA-binding XRE family transcriptional regulator
MSASAARKLPRTGASKKKGTSRPLRKATANLRVVKGKGLHIELKWTEGCMRDLQRKCYFLRRAHNLTQEELAGKCDLHKGTIIRYEDETIPMLAPRLKTFVQIFKKGFGAHIAVDVSD